MLSEGHILEQLQLAQPLQPLSDSGEDKHFPSLYIVNEKGLNTKHSSAVFNIWCTKCLEQPLLSAARGEEPQS